MLTRVLCITLVSACLARGGEIVINEIMYHPAPAVPEDPSREWIELYNSGTNFASLAGWKFTRGVDFTFPAGSGLSPGRYLVVAADFNAFTAAHPEVDSDNVVGGWIGRLSNSDEALELVNGQGEVVDQVHYATEGDWAQRVRGPSLQGTRGWEWFAEHDGLGKSLELANPALSHESGQNWASSSAAGGTPGRQNSAFSTDIAPMILDVKHFPVVPVSTSPVTVNARIADEQTNGLTVTLFYRNHTGDYRSGTPPSFNADLMADDGLHDDGAAGDGVYGAVLDPLPNGAIIEFYVQATDTSGHTRTWPAPAREVDESLVQAANALFQVDNEATTTDMPFIRLVATGTEREIFRVINSNSDAEMNATFVSVDADGPKIRYNVGFRIRGAGSRSRNPKNLRVNIPSDRRWNNVNEINLNTQFIHAQLAGSVLAQNAGLTCADTRRVQVRLNGVNLAPSGPPQNGSSSGAGFGSYLLVEAINGDWADQHFPTDSGGNVYRASRAPWTANLDYLGTDSSAYETAGYSKTSNQSESDWTDLFGLTYALSPNTPDADYVETVRTHANVDQWLTYFAVCNFFDYQETSLCRGVGDDYAMYRGLADPRFKLVAHDFDTILGQGDTGGSMTRSIWAMIDNPASTDPTQRANFLDRFLRHPEFAPSYFRILKQICDTTFASNQFNPLIDQMLSGWVPEQLTTPMKTFAAGRRASILAQIPQTLTISNSLQTASGFPFTTTPIVTLFGSANAIETRSVRVNGELAEWTAWQGRWTATITLQPGINRVLVQSFDSNNREFASAVADVWYDDGSVTDVSGAIAANTAWTAEDGPYRVTSHLTIGSGATLTIAPGATVYLGSGVNLVVADGGRLLAEGTAAAPIRFTRVPGSGANWGGIQINGSDTSSETRIAYAHLDFNSETAIHSTDGTVFLNHLTFGNPAEQYLSLDRSSFVVQDCVFPATTASFEPVHGTGGIKAGGRGIFLRNFFGPITGYNDTIDFTGGHRPGPVVQIINNVFMGSGDDNLDLDNTDAWVEGNLFLHVHKNGSPDTSSAISGGSDTGEPSDVTIIGNLLYDCDHAAMVKQGGFYTLLHNTIVRQTHQGGLDTEGAVICLADNNMSEGAGMYLEGNIIYDAEKLVRNQTNAIVTFTNNLMPLPWAGPGGSNSTSPPLLSYIPQLSETMFANWQQAQVLRDWFRLQTGSPARGAGPNGRDLGGVIPRGVSISGEPTGRTSQTTATLTVGVNRSGSGISSDRWPDGAGYTHYQWRLDGGAWSAETPLSTPITVSELANGLHRVEAIGRNDAGWYQNDPVFGPDAVGTPSRVWIVDTNYTPPIPKPLLRINEVLAANQAAAEHEETFPDMIELHNAGDAEADLSGLGVSDDPTQPGQFRFPPGTVLPAGGYLVLYADTPNRTTGIHLGFNLNKAGDSVYLFDTAAHSNAVIDAVTFGLQLTDLSIGRLADGNWALTQPTLGAANVPVAVGSELSLRISEWLAAPPAGQVDFIELYNPASLPVALGSLYFTDNAIGWPAQHQIAPLSFIPASSFLVFLADNDTAAGADHLGFKLSTERGMIALLDRSFRIIDQVFYGPQTTGVSEGRSPSGGTQIGFFDPPTPGAPNPGSSSGVTIINTVINLAAWTNLWRYEVSGTDFGTAWRAPGYGDSSWPSGRGMFYQGDSGGFPVPINTWLPISLPLNRSCFYFRTHFNLNTNAAGFSLVTSHYIDDAAVYYLNGVEIYRYNMPGGTINFSTWAASVISGNPGLIGPISLPTANLVQGDNVLAVEVHQFNSGSSDIALGLTLDLLRSETNYNALPVALNEVMANNVTLTNTDGSVTDWVELYNPATASADLSDMSLSDDVLTPRRWVFPAGVTIPSGGYLVVRCDPDSPVSSNNVPPLNTGFGLKANGDRIWLFDKPASGMAQLDGLAFGLQAADYSLARVPRANGKGNWILSLPTLGSLNIAASLGDASAVRINEWMADPRNGDDWFELYNPNDQPVALGGYYLTDDLNSRAKSRIPPYSYLGHGGRAYALFLADSQPGLGADHANFKFAKEGEAIGLVSPSGQFIDGFRFGAQSTGISQGRLPDGSANIVSFPDSASPGAGNYLPLSQVVVSEVLPNPDSPLEDAVELYNPTAESLNIGGWWLSNARHDLQRFRIPDGTILLPDGYAVFYRYQLDPDFTDLAPSFSLDRAGGDEIFLSQVDVLARLTGYRAVAEFGAGEKGVSFGRYETSVGADFTALSGRTFGADSPATLDEFRSGTGAPNHYPKLGPLLVNEIMYHPPDLGTNDNTRDEFIELYNATVDAVPLFDTNFPTHTWHVRDGVEFDFPTNVVLPAQGFLLLVNFDPATNAADLDAFRALYSVPTDVPILGPYSGKLANDGESIDLRRPDAPVPEGQPGAGRVPYIRVDRIRYTDAAPWPTAADGSTNQPGVSLQRRAAVYGNDPVNWYAGAPTAGRPSGEAVTAPGTITDLTPAQLVEAGADVTLTVAAGGAAPLQYQWRFNGLVIPGATNTTLLLPGVQTTNAGRYSVLVVNPAGAASAGTRVDVKQSPRIARQPEHQIVAESTTAIFTVGVSGTPPLHYQWHKGNDALDGATGAALIVTNVQPVHEGNYFVVVTNVYGADTSTVASLLIQTPPFLTTQPQGTNVYVGETAFFSVEAGGSEPLHYQWRFNGVNLAGATNATLVLTSVQPAQAGGYTVLVTNAVNRVLSATATLGVGTPPVITVQAATPLGYEAGEQPGAFRLSRAGTNPWPVTVYFDLGGTAAPADYRTFPGSITLPAGTNALIFLVTPNDDSEREPDETVVLTLATGRGYVVGSPASATVTLIDSDNARPTVVLTEPTPGGVFFGPTNISLMATASDPDGSIVRVEFYRGGTNLLGASTSETSSFAFTWTNALRGSHSLTAVAIDDLGARTVSAPVAITVTSPLTGFADLFVERGTVTGLTNTLRGTNTTFTRESGEPRHEGRSGTRSAWVAWTAPGYGPCTMDTFGSAFDTVLAVYLSEGASLQSVSNLIRVASNDDADRTTSQSRLTFTAAAGVTYQIAVDGYGPTDSGIIVWHVSQTDLDPFITLPPRSQSVSAGAAATFTVSAIGTGPLSYQWQLNGNDLPGETGEVLVVSNAQPARAGTYRVVVRNASAAQSQADATLTVLPPTPILVLRHPQGLSVRSGETATLDVAAEGTGPLRYQWQLYGTNLPGATNATLLLTNIDMADSGPYQVVITNADGAVTSEMAVLLVDDDLVFRILDLQTNGAMAIDINSLVGYDQSGIAVSPGRLFIAGQSGTATWDAGNFSGGTRFTNAAFAGLVANLRTEQIYVLANGSTPITGGNTITSLLELNGETGAPTGSRINLSTNFYLGWGSGVFVGYDRIVLHNNNDYHLYDIALPSGRVRDLGYTYFSHSYPYYGWAFYGMAEYYAGAIHLVFVQDWQTVGRVRVGAGQYLSATPVAQFDNLGNMANLAFSPSRSRWYFRHRYSSQFSSRTENAGSAKALFATGAGVPAIFQDPQPQLSYPDSNVTFRVVASGLEPLSYQWQRDGTNLAGANGATLLLSNVQPESAGYYSVIVGNSVASVPSSPAELYVVSTPEILTQPAPRSVTSGSNTTFSINYRAAPPYFFQWRLNGTNIADATNDTLTLSNISSFDIGLYSVAISNRYGVTVSSNAVLALIIDTGFSFRIRSLGRDATLVEHQDVTGGDSDGLAIGADSVLYNGSAGAGRFAAADLSGGSALGRFYQALVSDLRQQRVYSLAYGTNLLGSGGGTVDNLREIDASTGVLRTNIVNLTQPIYAGWGSGLFAGYGQIVIVANGRAYAIAMPSGVVADLGYTYISTHQNTPDWAYWGVAENFGGSTYVVYAQNSNSIVRTRIPDGVTTTVANFVDLGNMACLSVSVPRGRWYFHYSGQNEFGGTNQTIGFCSASFDIEASQVVDHFAWGPIAPQQFFNSPIAVTLTAQNVLNSTVTNFSGPVDLAAINADTSQPVPVVPPIAVDFTNGVWAGVLTLGQPADRLFLRAQDLARHLGDSATFSVEVSDDLRVTIAAPPLATVGAPFLYTLSVSNSGPHDSTAVRLTNWMPPGTTFSAAAASQGSFTNLDNEFICDLGTLGPASAATITLVLIPESIGSITNIALVARHETDARPENNTATLTTPVLQPFLAISDAATNEGTGGSTQFRFTVTLSGSNAQMVSVGFFTSNGTARSSVDYQGVSGTLFFPPGVTSASSNVTVYADSWFEPEKVFYVVLTNPANSVIVRGTGVMTIRDDDLGATLTALDTASPEGNSGVTNASMTLRLSRAIGVLATVGFATVDGTAIAGSDYVATNGTVTFQALATTATLRLGIIGNTRGEPDKRFYVRLFDPVNTTLLTTQAVVTIVNDDGLGVLDHFEWAGVESNAWLNVPIPVTITARDFNGSLATNFNGQVSLNGIGGGGVQSLTLGTGTTTWDYPLAAWYEDGRCSSIYPASDLGGGRRIFGLALNVTGLPGQTLNSWTIRMKHTTRSSFTSSDDWDNTGWTVVYQNNETLRATGWVNFAFSTPFDYNGADNLLVDFSFNDENWSSYGYVTSTSYAQSRTMLYRCDSCVAGGPLQWTRNNAGASISGQVPNLRLVLSSGLSIAPTNSTRFTNGVWDGTVRVLEPASEAQLSARDTNQHFGVSRYFDVLPYQDLALRVTTSASPTPVWQNLVYTLTVSNSGPTAFHNVALTNRFPANADFLGAAADHGAVTNTGSTVVNQIELLDPAEVATLTLWTRPTNMTVLTNVAGVTRDGPEFFLANNTVTTVTRAVLLELATGDATLKEGDDGSTNAIFNVSLSAPSTNVVSVAFFTADDSAIAGLDYGATNGVLEFAPGITNLTITVPVFGDLLNESNEAFTVTLLNATNAPISWAQGVGLILNDDPMPIIRLSDVTVAEGHSGLTRADFTLTLSEASGQRVTVDFRTADGTGRSALDYVFTNGTVEVPPGAASVALSVLVRGDTAAENDETFFVRLSAPVGGTLGTVEGVATIANDDGLIGQVSLFNWGPISSPQMGSRNFPVTISARDSLNNLVTNFSGAIALRAVVPGDLTNTVLLGDMVFTNSGPDPLTLAYTFIPSVDLTVTHVRHYSGAKVSIWTDTGTLILSKDISGPDGAWSETLLDTPQVLNAGVAYRIGVFNGDQHFYYSLTGPATLSHGTLGLGYVGNGDAFPTNSADIVYYFGVDLRFTAPGLPRSVPIMPNETTAFVNGVWSGEVLIPEAATNLQLVAEAGQASGISNPFDVLFLRSDVSALGTAWPGSAVADKQVTLNFTLFNRGPDDAPGARLTNWLPSGLDFVSARPSQGDWTNDGTRLIFDLGTLTRHRSAQVVITARAVYPGAETNLAAVVTNLAAVTHDALDTNPANNQVAILVTLLMDSDRDGMPDVWEETHGLNRVDFRDAAEDADGDGLLNLQEYVYATDPRDLASMVRITRIDIAGADVVLSFPTVAGRRYELQTTLEPMAQPRVWTPLPGRILGDGESATFVHSAGASQPQCFYRVVVVQ